MLALLWTVLSGDCEMPSDLSETVVLIFFKSSAGVLSPEFFRKNRSSFSLLLH